MGSFPTSKVHRPSRRQLGRGQSVPVPPVAATADNVSAVVTVTFDVPVIVDGAVDLHVAGIDVLSQEQASSTTLTITYASTVAGKTWSIDASAPVRSFQGGVVAAAAGTF